MEIREEEREKKQQYLRYNDSEFSKINIRHQTTDPGSSENTKQEKLQNNEPKRTLRLCDRQ